MKYGNFNFLEPFGSVQVYSAVYHVDRPVSWVTVGWKLGAGRLDKCPGCRIACSPNAYPACLHLTSNQQQPKKLDDPCGHQHYSRELLMMGIEVPETC